MRTMLLIALALTGCESKEGAGDPGGCPRHHTWRDPIDVSSGSASVLVTEDCGEDLIVTDVELKGAGFSAELPEIDAIIPAGTWEIAVRFDTEGIVEPGEYSGVLYLSAEGLAEDGAPKDLYALVD